MADRCGSYPIMNLAADFGIDYGDALVLFDACLWIERGVRIEDVPSGRLKAIEAAVERCKPIVGERETEFAERMWELSKARAAA